MSELSQKKILILDCQSTGMQAKTSHLLQIGWSVIDGFKPSSPLIEKWVLKLPNGQEIPRKIMRMQNITENDLLGSVEPRMVFDRLQLIIQSLGSNPIVVAHYAQFERSFLKQFYLEQTNTEELNFEFICTQRIARRLLPNLPSHNLKALSGYLQMESTSKNEVTSHVLMSIKIWQYLVSKLEEIAVTSDISLFHWLTLKDQKINPRNYEYNIAQLARLELTSKPGIYRMLAKDKTILYIGKATSLKSRVNSYFRGKKNKDRRLLEMLAQVWHIETIECPTPLEAALLESDEIKRCNPPYNILLKSDVRKLIFYNRDYSDCKEAKDNIYFYGPFKPYDALMLLLQLLNALKSNQSIMLYNEIIEWGVLKASWDIFVKSHNLDDKTLEDLSFRSILMISHNLLTAFENTHGVGAFEKWWLREKKKHSEIALSAEQKIAQKMTRMFLRVAEVKRKSRRINRLFNSELLIVDTQKKITIVNGDIIGATNDKKIPNKSPEFKPHHYDRLSILLSAKNKKTVIFV